MYVDFSYLTLKDFYHTLQVEALSLHDKGNRTVSEWLQIIVMNSVEIL